MVWFIKHDIAIRVWELDQEDTIRKFTDPCPLMALHVAFNAIAKRNTYSQIILLE